MDDLKQSLGELAKLLKPFAELSRIRLDRPKGVEQVEQALQKVPPASSLAPTLEEVLGRVRDIVETGKAGREHLFRKVEAEFVNARKTQGARVRELDHGWRIGHFELTVNRAQARARVLFNHEVIIDWAPVREPRQMEELFSAADKKLSLGELPIEMVQDAIRGAYEAAKSQRSSARVSMPDLFRAFRVFLVQEELKRGTPDKKLTSAEFPKWKFLHCLDRYRQLGSGVGDGRLTFETGSQHDQSKGLGMTVNGLSPEQDYKVVCWAFRAETRQ